jgi:hypothetical protein
MKVDEPPQKYQWLERLGKDEMGKEMTIQRFDIQHSKAAVEDLRQRLARTRRPGAGTVGGGYPLLFSSFAL